MLNDSYLYKTKLNFLIKGNRRFTAGSKSLVPNLRDLDFTLSMFVGLAYLQYILYKLLVFYKRYQQCPIRFLEQVTLNIEIMTVNIDIGFINKKMETINMQIYFIHS